MDTSAFADWERAQSLKEMWPKETRAKEGEGVEEFLRNKSGPAI